MTTHVYAVRQIFDFDKRYVSPFSKDVAYLSLDKEYPTRRMATLYKAESVFNVEMKRTESQLVDQWSPRPWSSINYRDAYKLILAVKEIMEDCDSYLEYKLFDLFGEEKQIRHSERLKTPGVIKIETKKLVHYYNGSKWVRLEPSNWMRKRVEY